MVTVEDFAAYSGAESEGDSQEDLARSLTVATTLIARELESAYRQPTEAEVDAWTLEVAHAHFRRNVTSSSEAYEGQAPLRAPNDPLQQVRPMIAKYVIYV